jgi:NurA-like 5'-3' nuclease
MTLLIKEFADMPTENQRIPTDKELDDSFRELQPFFNRVDEYYKEFMRLKSTGRLYEVE